MYIILLIPKKIIIVLFNANKKCNTNICVSTKIYLIKSNNIIQIKYLVNTKTQ